MAPTPVASPPSGTHDGNNNTTWDGPPPPPTKNNIHNNEAIKRDPSCQGIVVGLILRDVLEGLLQQQQQQQQEVATAKDHDTEDAPSTAADDDGGAGNGAVTFPIRLDKGIVNNIWASFTDAVAESQENELIQGPPILLRGRLEHYNRRDHKWRLQVTEAEFRERQPLDRHRRKRERPSLWQIAAEEKQPPPSRRPHHHHGHSTTTDDANTRKLDLEILAYNDL